jgi:hypothetical protein
MPKPPDPKGRRQVREKAVIEHLAKRLYQPAASGVGEQTVHGPTTSTGLPVEEQVRKEWNPGKGGLPIFSRTPGKKP